MGKLNKDNKGFGGVELILVIVIVVLLGVVGWFVYKNHNKTTPAKVVTLTKAVSSTSNKSTSTELIAVAQKVFWQAPNQTQAKMDFCGSSSTVSGCPFTTELTTETNDSNTPSNIAADTSNSSSLLVENNLGGPEGTLSYSATPSSTGGTVNVSLAPASSGEGLSWELTIVDTNGTLEVSNMTVSSTGESQTGVTSTCGPIEIYDWIADANSGTC